MMTAKAAPAAQPMVEQSTEPPMMKNAGRIPPYYEEGDAFAALVMVAALICLVTGGMLQALMSNRNRTARGAVFHGALCVLALVILLAPLDYEEQVGTLDWGQALISWTWPIAVLWLVVGGLGFVVGKVVRPPPT